MRAIDSETDHYVLGPVRAHCEENYLKEVDAAIAEYLKDAKEDILNSCREILAEFAEKQKLHRYVLNKESIDYLLNMLKKEELIKKIRCCKENKIFKNNYFTNAYFVDFYAEEVKILLDELSDNLINRGLDKNSEPNQLGLQIERLIDVFSDVFYDEE